MGIGKNMTIKNTIISIEGYKLPDGAKNVTPEDSVIPVYLIPLTPEEEAERAQWAKDEQERQAAIQAKEDARQSALEKLAKLGLTEDEAKAIAGI